MRMAESDASRREHIHATVYSCCQLEAISLEIYIVMVIKLFTFVKDVQEIVYAHELR